MTLATAQVLTIPPWFYVPTIGLALIIGAVRSWHSHVERVRAWKRAQARLHRPAEQFLNVRNIEPGGRA